MVCSIFFIAWCVSESMLHFFNTSPVILCGGNNFFFIVCTTFVICLSLKKFFIFSVLIFTGFEVSSGRLLIRDCVMAGTESSDVAFGQFSLVQICLTALRFLHLYILSMEIPESW